MCFNPVFQTLNSFNKIQTIFVNASHIKNFEKSVPVHEFLQIFAFDYNFNEVSSHLGAEIISDTLHNMSETENKELTQEDGPKDYVEDGKNKLVVKCKFCGSKILDKKSGKYVVQEKELPLMQQDANRKEGEFQNETVKEFYHVENMYTFENIGFTHTVANHKYLSCADCDAGPVGYYDLDTKHSYVALSRIVHC